MTTTEQDQPAATTRRARAAPPADPVRAGRNEIVLASRLPAGAEFRELPSGDTVAVWRLVVPRDPRRDAKRDSAPSRPKVDTIECSAFSARVRQRAEGWQVGSWLEVRGTLHRRFWQTPGGPQSRYEVEAEAVKVLAKPA